MTRLFISYSHKDRAALDQFRKVLEREVAATTTIFSDIELEAGDLFHERLKHECFAADATIFLVSKAFLKSRFCMSVELMWGIERAYRQDTPLVPVILEPCDWANEVLKHFHTATRDARPISDYVPPESGFREAAESVRSALDPKGAFLWYGPSEAVAIETLRQSKVLWRPDLTKIPAIVPIPEFEVPGDWASLETGSHDAAAIHETTHAHDPNPDTSLPDDGDDFDDFDGQDHS